MRQPNQIYSFDSEYVERLRNGDPATERHFVAYFGELLRLKLRNRLGTRSLEEEARQEVFLRVLSALKRDGIEHAERFGAFVNAVANHVVLEYYRNENRAAPMPEKFNPPDTRVDLERAAVSAQQRAAVHRFMKELPDLQQQLLKEVFLEEQDKETVCRRHGVDRAYLRVLLHRARKRFALLLESS